MKTVDEDREDEENIDRDSDLDCRDLDIARLGKGSEIEEVLKGASPPLIESFFALQPLHSLSLPIHPSIHNELHHIFN